MRSSIVIAGLVAGLLGMPFATLAAEQEQVRVFGTIESVDGKTITARNEDGSTVTFEATNRIVSNQPITLAGLRAGLSVALDTVERNGRTIVTHVHTQGWDRAPDTNPTRPLNSDASVTRHLGKITTARPIAGGVELEVAHEGGQSSITVDVMGNVPIIYHNREETEAALQPGMMVMANATRGENGQFGAGFVTVEVGDAKPVQLPD